MILLKLLLFFILWDNFELSFTDSKFEFFSIIFGYMKIADLHNIGLGFKITNEFKIGSQGK